MLDQVGDAEGDDASLPAAGAGEDQQWAVSSFDGFALLRVELVEKRQAREVLDQYLEFQFPIANLRLK